MLSSSATEFHTPSLCDTTGATHLMAASIMAKACRRNPLEQMRCLVPPRPSNLPRKSSVALLSCPGGSLAGIGKLR